MKWGIRMKSISTEAARYACRMWVKCGSQPQIKSAPTQEKAAFRGFINPVTGQLVINECEKFNYGTIMESVKMFRAVQPSKKILIIMDNASWHKKAVRLMREEGSDIEFLFLPPYLFTRMKSH